MIHIYVAKKSFYHKIYFLLKITFKNMFMIISSNYLMFYIASYYLQRQTLLYYKKCSKLFDLYLVSQWHFSSFSIEKPIKPNATYTNFSLLWNHCEFITVLYLCNTYLSCPSRCFILWETFFNNSFLFYYFRHLSTTQPCHFLYISIITIVILYSNIYFTCLLFLLDLIF